MNDLNVKCQADRTNYFETSCNPLKNKYSWFFSDFPVEGKEIHLAFVCAVLLINRWTSETHRHVKLSSPTAVISLGTDMDRFRNSTMRNTMSQLINYCGHLWQHYFTFSCAVLFWCFCQHSAFHIIYLAFSISFVVSVHKCGTILQCRIKCG